MTAQKLNKAKLNSNFLDSTETKNIALTQVSLNAGRQEILEYFQNGWNLTEFLFSGLASEEAYYIRPYHSLRHPMIFYYGHPVALYINKLRVAGLIKKPVQPELEALLETGVDEMRWDDLHDGKDNIWPTIQQVRDYRSEVYDIICDLIKTHPLLEPENMPITQESPMWALVMGFEHERIHLETSSVLMRELPSQYVKKPGKWPENILTKSDKKYPANEMVKVPETEVLLGKPANWPTFGWDNEYGSETRKVNSFSASRFLISNGEFHEFVKAGGYTEEKYWSREGWAWRRFRNIRWPTFWVQNGPSGSHIYKLRTIFEIIDMQEDWPVCVNFHEAKAYCAWRTESEGKAPYRLLTEAEHNAIRDGREYSHNLDLKSGSESPVDAFPENTKGFHDVFGNVWQWCEDHFHQLTGGKPHPYYDDFSMPCYDGEHQMMLGGSFISTGDESGPWARFHFRAHFFQHAGFRIVQSDNVSDARIIHKAGTSPYDTQEMLNKYLLMHWGSDPEIYANSPSGKNNFPGIVNLPVKCAELIKKYSSGFDSALDLGCAVGRSSFEMARDFKEVTGIDYSREFVDAADILKRNGKLSYYRRESGSEVSQIIANVDNAIQRSRINFEQGDACALPPHLKGFDAVLLANVLCRLRAPAVLLKRMQEGNALVKPGGILVMTTPFSWLHEYTPESQWVKDIDAVQKILDQFELVHQEELPFIIREHKRKFEYIVTQASVWRRK